MRVHRWTKRDGKTVPVTISSKKPKTVKSKKEYISLLKGKKYLTYFRTEDIIIDVVFGKCGWEYLVEDEAGKQRTHGTYIYPEEVY